MRKLVAAILLAICAMSSRAQSLSPTLESQVIAKYPLLLGTNHVTLVGNATWEAGKLHESGIASFEADSDGATEIKLDLGSASRQEHRATLAANRKCSWVDQQGVERDIVSPDCRKSIPWFSPMMLFAVESRYPDMFTVSSSDVITSAGSNYKKFSSVVKTTGSQNRGTRLVEEGTRVDILLNPETLLPASMEYSLHSDRDWNRSVKVRVEYSDYQTASGVPVPYQIDQFVNGVLQLSVTLSTVSFK